MRGGSGGGPDGLGGIFTFLLFFPFSIYESIDLKVVRKNASENCFCMPLKMFFSSVSDLF